MTLLAQDLRDIAADLEIITFSKSLDVDSDLDSICADAVMIVNSADRPYIGYTSIFLSRFCMKKNIPLFVLGGFDAHLGSLGELIVPGVTPCADCYDNYFKNALKDWKPEAHPVVDRSLGFGGLGSLSVFSASVAALKILSYFASDSGLIGDEGRGELVFSTYELLSFTVPRNPSCSICANLL